MIAGAWKSAVLTYGTDDDLTAEVDLGDNYQFLTVLIPELNVAAITSVHVGNVSGGTFYPVHGWEDYNGDNTVLLGTTNATTSVGVTFRIGGVQYIKIATSNAQGANITFIVRGFN